MISFTSVLSLFVLMFVSSCFALPFDRNEYSTSTFSPSFELVTQDHLDGNEIISSSESMRSAEETTFVPSMSTEQTRQDQSKLQVTSSNDDKQSEEDPSRATRQFDVIITSEFTTGSSFVTSQSNENDLSWTNIDTSSQVNQQQFNEENKQKEFPWKLTEPTTTNEMLTSKSPEKYLGHLEDETEKPIKIVRLTTKSMKKVSKALIKVKEEEEEEKTNESKENNSNESTFLKAEYDPKALDQISTLSNNQMQYDENKQSIPYLPTESTKHRKEQNHRHDHDEQQQKEKALNQGEKSSITEEKESNH